MKITAILPLILSILAQCQAKSVNEKAIEIIEGYMDLSEDPCEDFFSYACGNWSQFHTNGRYSESTGLIDHKINKRILDLFKRIEEGIEIGNVIEEQVITYFRSCRRDRKRRNTRYLKLVKPAAGINWPLLDAVNDKVWAKDKFDSLLAVANLRRYGLNNVLLEEIVTQNLTNSTQYVIDLDKPNLSVNPLPSQLKIVANLVESGLSFMKAFQIVQQVKEFESKIESLLEIEDEYGVLVISLNDIIDDLPQFSWQKYFENLLGQPVSLDYVFQLRNYAYFVELQKLLQDTDDEIICNYLMFKFLYSLMVDRSASADKIDCIVDVRSKMDLAMNFIYAERFYKREAQLYNEDVRQLIEIIRREFFKKLYENRLNLSRAELEFLDNKLKAMDLNMGNLPKNVNRQFVEHYYETIKLSRRDYYKNHLDLLKLRFEKEHDVLNKGRPKAEDYFFIADSDTARSSTPFYLVRQNLIVVPFGFLQTPIYHHNMLNVLKYSLLGFNIAHEIAHGFDASGVLFDYQGSVQEIGAKITENSIFQQSLNCMQRDETTSLDERVADLVGLRLAYDSFFNYDVQRGEREAVGKNKLETIFFLNFAQFFCGNLGTEFMDHDSDNVRLQQTLLNFEPFAKNFQCDLGATMHPEEKCRLW